MINTCGGKDGVCGLLETSDEVRINSQVSWFLNLFISHCCCSILAHYRGYQSRKPAALLQQCYGLVFTIKNLHEFGHQTYFVACRNYLHKKYGISLNQSKLTSRSDLRIDSVPWSKMDLFYRSSWACFVLRVASTWNIEFWALYYPIVGLPPSVWMWVDGDHQPIL